MPAQLKRDLRGTVHYRDAALVMPAGEALTEEMRTFEASLSSELPVRRWDGSEVLDHSPEAVNLTRAMDGKMPLLFNHDGDELIGMVTNLRVENARLRGTLTFSQFSDHGEVIAQIREGMPFGISIGYQVDEWTESATSEEYRVTKWTLYEASVVSVPADPTVGINRSHSNAKEGKAMSQQITGNPGNPSGTDDQRQAASVHQIAEAERTGETRAQERVREIMELFSAPGFRAAEYIEMRDKALADATPIEAVRKLLLAKAGAGITPVSSEPSRQDERVASVQAGVTDLEKFRAAALEAVEIRAGIITDPVKVGAARRENEMLGMTLAEVARESLRRVGVDMRGWDRMRIVGEALIHRGTTQIVSHGGSDFANVLLDSANKSLLHGWQENPETFQKWTRAQSLNDFKTSNLINLSGFSDLDLIAEGAEYKYGTMADVKEQITLVTYGKLFSISRQAIINDDLSAFTMIPSLMGRAAARSVGDAAYAVLTSNPTMKQDSLALFHTTHNNFQTTGAAPSVSTLDYGWTKMAVQTDNNANTLNVVPRFLIVPRALENTSKVLMGAQYDPAGAAGTLKPNPFNGMLEVVADARLDTFNSLGWFLSADPRVADTVVVGYLNGQQSPYMEQLTAFTVDGVGYKVRMDCAAAPADFRGLFYNDGA